jgi:hypothetical protein
MSMPLHMPDALICAGENFVNVADEPSYTERECSSGRRGQHLPSITADDKSTNIVIISCSLLERALRCPSDHAGE